MQTCKRKGIIVTGATGYIGSSLVTKLKTKFEDSHEIVPLSSACDLRTLDTFTMFDKLSKNLDVEYIFHLAANARSGEWLANNPAQAWYDNTLINANVFEAARRFTPKAKITTALSYSIYAPNIVASTESEISFRTSEDNLSAYANSKIAVLAAQDAYNSQYNLNCSSIVLPTVYGPSLSAKNVDNGQAITAICRKFIDAINHRSPEVLLWGNGKQERDLLFIDDAIDAIVCSAVHQKSMLINIGFGSTTAIHQLANMIADITGYKGKVIYNQAMYEGPQTRCLNTDKAKKELNWSPRTELRDGLAKTIQFIGETYHTRMD